ncbi:NAD-dependent epimerase/dehydratase family protein [Nocardia cyriacigeorgica]|uniref:NAD-dependent epimerase/dehydratase family protein n=1 Tax=Nocardia cyriacigeorgica TaxID=135487 RepID=UPI000308A934|nr:NAD-dependent epimerase/dehydratase family protein [Nocardia cyriacigeorgica]MBF6423136.1 NAD-dependent epimerase/dehydratase family protein [Nocardia cyriacigeorgica]BDT87535.1 NAD-dependent epimerase [Nocardia cyriacigeorgica]
MTLSVVVGAGGVGTITAHLLADAGHEVRLITRSGNGPQDSRIQCVAADAGDTARLIELTTGAQTLFNCAAPPYHRWHTDLLPLFGSLLATAEATRADYVMLGNLYGYGAPTAPMTEDLPMAPNSVKGRIRAQAWQEALAAHEAGRVRVTEVRSSDFLGRGGQSNFAILVAPKVIAGKTALFPADLDAPHSWTGTGDAARTLVTVAQDDRAWGRAWHVPSNPPVTPRQLADRLAAVAGASPARLRRMPGWMLRAAGLFSPVARELPEVLYQLDRPFVLDSTLTEKTFGLAPTSLDTILREMTP